MYHHRAATFAYEQYQREALGLVEQVDKGSYDLLRTRACEAIRHFRQEWPVGDLGWTASRGLAGKQIAIQQWPLFGYGEGALPDDASVFDLTAPAPADIGFWFLLVLAEYLSPCPSPEISYGIVSRFLTALGWNEQESDALFHGLSTSLLLKPDVPPTTTPLKEAYWSRLRPRQAKWCGWLSTSQVRSFFRRLSSDAVAEKMGSFDVRCMLTPDVDRENVVVVREYQELLQSGYRDTLAMLDAAARADRGLFTSIVML